MKKFIIYTDGASRGNPGQSSAGFVIKDVDGVIWHQECVYLGKATNNFAEYMAVKLALERFIKNFRHTLPARIEFRVDALLIASQLSGIYKIKSQSLKQIYDQIKLLESQAGIIIYKQIPRAENFLADRLANLALDQKLSSDG